MSIKRGERDERWNTGQIRRTASRKDQVTPKQFRNYLSVGANYKVELLDFLLNDWQDQWKITTTGKKRIFVNEVNEKKNWNKTTRNRILF